MRIIKKISQLFFLSFCISGFSQSIVVNPASQPESNLNAEDLTKEVLIDGGACSSISNFTKKDNYAAQFPNANRSWGYFENGNSNFPFERGIVLTSGFAREAQGPSAGIVSKGDYSWLGDNDANVLAGNGTNNATVFEFDFTPFGDHISFNYIFASEEYPDFTCTSFNDVFAFIISGPGITNDPGLSGRNIARLPNGLPVTINNVNDSYCGDNTYYVAGPFGDIQYGGRTTVLTAEADVIPGSVYHIRLLVADSTDYMYDSAVFLEAGSFNLGSELVDLEGADLGDNQTVCGESSFTIVAQVNAPGATFQWYFNGDLIPGATGSSYTATESGYYSVQIISASCSTEAGVELDFRDKPEVSPFSVSQCSASGSYTFNLSDYNSEISTTPGSIYSFFNTFEGAQTANPADRINNFTNFPVSTGTTIVYVRVATGPGCFEVAELTLTVGEGPETMPQTYELCDDDGDGFAVFDLTSQAASMVVSGPAGLTFEYYLDAATTQEIDDPTAFTNTSNPQQIYVKIYDGSSGTEDCISVEILTLEVNEFPELQPDEITICDNLNDNSEFINLTQNEIVVTPGITTTLHYFEEIGGPEITDPANYEVTSSPTVIHVLVQNADGSCEDYQTLTIYFNEAPEVENTALNLCSDDDTATFHLPDAIGSIVTDETGLDFNFYETYNDAMNGGNNQLPDDYTNTTNTQIVYVRVENENGCYNIAEVELEVHNGPESLPFTAELCDDDGDGFAVFNLTAYGQNLVANPDNIEFGYFLDADATQSIANPTAFTNTTNPQTIFVVLVDNTDPNLCASIGELTLMVNEFPELQPDEITICDNLNDNSEFINLTQNEIVVTPGITTTLHYFEEIGGPEITDPANYEVTSSPTVIHVLVQNADGSCEDYQTLTIYFNEAPEVENTALNLCSDDDTATFHLPDAIGSIVTDETGLDFNFYETYNDALNGGNNQLPDDYTNTTNTQIVYVRVENENGCYNIAEVELEVHNGPESLPFTAELCDDDGDGFAVFDLTVYGQNLVANPDNIEFGYFLDADATQSIANPTAFTNTTNPQTIFVVLVDNTDPNLCASIGELTLVVNEFPELQPDEITICDNLNDNSEFINLTQNEIVVTPGITTTLHYFEEIGGPEITDPANYEVTSSPTVIHVLVQNADGSCEDYQTLTINFMDAPVVTDELIVIENCSLTPFANFYLPSVNQDMVDDTSGLNFSYHLTFNDAANGVSGLSDNYQNTSANQVIYVRVQNANGCYDIGEVMLTTVLKHEVIPDTLVVCDDPYEESDGIARFDLTLYHNQIEAILGGSDYTIKYFTSIEDAVDGINPIQNPENFQNQTNPQTIYAQASSGQGGCAGVVDFNIEVLPVPVFELPNFVAFCIDDFDKSFTFNDEFETYQWTDSSGTIVSNAKTVNFTQEGFYTLEVTQSGMDCPAKRDVEVIFDTPPVILEIQVDGNTVKVYANGGYTPYQYSYNNGLTWDNSGIFYNFDAGIFEMIVKSKYGCISTAKTFGVLGIPNFISPNGDGKNDTWFVRGLEAYPDAHIKIFDRYGKLFVDRKLGTNFVWDGTYMGRPVASGEYWYIITFEDGKKLSGHISVRNY